MGVVATHTPTAILYPVAHQAPIVSQPICPSIPCACCSTIQSQPSTDILPGFWVAFWASPIFWAVAAILIAWILEPAISRLVPRIKKVKTPWFEVELQQQMPSPEAINLLRRVDVETLRPNDAVVLLCYRIYQIITQSQMAALEIVRMRRTTSESEVKAKWRLASSEYGEVVSYQLWVDFLQKWDLWQYHLDERDDTKALFTITAAGETFLRVCFDEHLHSQARPF